MTSEYEKERINRIIRNNAKLKSLGLISALEEERSNRAAKGEKLPSSTAGSNTKIKKPEDGKKRKRVKKEVKVATRKSRRLQGLDTELKGIIGEDDLVEFSKEDIIRIRNEEDGYAGLTQEDILKQEALTRERNQRVRECAEMRQKAVTALAEACGSFDAAAKKNPTATYDHALMRIQSMTHKGLANRIKAIERALGRHSIIKMAIFKSALQDEGLWDLAGQADQALERLKGLAYIV